MCSSLILRVLVYGSPVLWSQIERNSFKWMSSPDEATENWVALTMLFWSGFCNYCALIL